MELSVKPVVLYHASIERMEACHRAFAARDYVLTAYLAGLAVECMLQSIAGRSGTTFDARHDLSLWLGKCPASFRGVIKGEASAEWSVLMSLWDNTLRYLSRSGFIGYVRAKRATRGISGGPASIVREIARRMLHAADIIVTQGMKEWLSYTKR